MFCPSCGFPNKSGAHCSSCGKSLDGSGGPAVTFANQTKVHGENSIPVITVVALALAAICAVLFVIALIVFMAYLSNESRFAANQYFADFATWSLVPGIPAVILGFIGWVTNPRKSTWARVAVFVPVGLGVLFLIVVASMYLS